MFLIHNKLREDCKIFDADEIPAPAELYKRINTNPEDMEEENLLTKIRSEYNKIEKEKPEIINRVEHLPNRTKTAKRFDTYNLVVFPRKALRLFIQKSSTIPKYSVRRIANLELKADRPKELKKFIKELELLISNLGTDYLEIVENRVKDNRDEIIIAVENISQKSGVQSDSD